MAKTKVLADGTKVSIGPDGAPIQQGGAGGSTLQDILVARLTAQGQGISSSASSQLKSTIDQAITETQAAGEAGSAALESQRQREVTFAQDRAAATYTGAMESRKGYATQVVGLRELTETTEKSIRDLDMRYKEAIMANDAQTARDVASLRVQKLQFLQEQEQNFYSNLMSLASMEQQDTQFAATQALQREQMSQQERQFQEQMGFDLTMFEKATARDERNMLLGMAAEYGVEVGPNETIESMIGKISPFVSEERQLRLAELQSSISANNASAARSLQALEQNDLNDVQLEALAQAYARGNGDVIGFVEDSAMAAKIIGRASQIEKERIGDLNILAKASANRDEFFLSVAQSSEVDATQAELDSLALIYEEDWLNREGTSYDFNSNLTIAEQIKRDRLMGVTISADRR